MNLEQLRAAALAGQRLDLLHFWGHRPRPDGRIGPTCLSQWWACDFEVDGDEYTSAEHFMMAEKARLFDDGEARERILSCGSPGAAKKLGRQVRGFREEAWLAHRFEIVVRGNLAKFEQNEPLRWFLLGTREKILVEASPYDSIWGIGLSAKDERAADPLAWRGLNLLGFALMEVRAQLTRRR